MIDPELLTLVAMVAGPGGAAWVAVKSSVNGLRDDVREIKADVKCIHTSVTRIEVEHGERIAKLEGKHE